MKKISELRDVIENYSAGFRYFTNLDFDKGEKLVGQSLTDATFENCYLGIDFSQTDFTSSKFIDCNLKTCDFSLCNLTKTVFENCVLDDAEFKNAKIENTILINCSCYGQPVTLNAETGELENSKDPLVKELYDFIPEFSESVDHTNDELVYTVYGQLSLELFENITTNEQLNDFAKRCFDFFNLLGDRQNEGIDNLLVVGVYEGLYANKKCNDIARQLLYGRNKDVYEYWMKNGNIRADY